MAQEMFFLTDKTRGGFILMVMLFYSAYVVGCAMWVETTFIIAAPSELCLTLGGCVFTLLRLTFYDGNGLDFLWSLSKDNKVSENHFSSLLIHNILTHLIPLSFYSQ